MKIDENIDVTLSGADIYSYGSLPVAAAYCRSINLIETVNELVPSQMGISPGVVVQAMVLDTLSGRTPLYRLEEFMAEVDGELLIGEDIDAKLFTDTNLGRSLDAIFAVGSSKVLTQLGCNAIAKHELDLRVVSYDTTSTNVWGDYRHCEGANPSPGPLITYGFSKDKRGDLKQFMTDLLCVEKGIPILGKTLDGNSSDKTSNNAMLTNLSSLMKRHGMGPGAFVYVADSSFVTKDNLRDIGDNLFISRFPASYNECSKAIELAVSKNEWTDIGILAKTKGTKNRPSASYKYHETCLNVYDKTYRAVVVHSSAHDKRRSKKLEREILNSEKEIKKELKKQTVLFACEQDAQQAVKLANKIHRKLHSVKASIKITEKRLQGRTPMGKKPATKEMFKISFEIIINTEKIQQLKTVAGCFVMITNVPKENNDMAMDGKGVLKTYKGQYAVEADFAFLKDPLITNDIFLKKNSRIDVLGMVLIIALMIWRLMERSMRAYIKNENTTLPGWDKKRTTAPTSFMMGTIMTGIVVLKSASGERLFLRKPKERQLVYLKALGLNMEVFLNCKFQCTPIIPKIRPLGG